MAFQPPKKSGFVRLSETEETRKFGESTMENNPNKLGKFCEGCDKYYDYMLPEEKYCMKCGSSH